MISNHKKSTDAASLLHLRAGSPPRPKLKPVRTEVPPAGFRRLHESEVVTPGDYVMNESQDIEPWEGPRGFRAGSFLKQIYRCATTAVPATR